MAKVTIEELDAMREGLSDLAYELETRVREANALAENLQEQLNELSELQEKIDEFKLEDDAEEEKPKEEKG